MVCVVQKRNDTHMSLWFHVARLFCGELVDGSSRLSERLDWDSFISLDITSVSFSLSLIEVAATEVAPSDMPGIIG